MEDAGSRFRSIGMLLKMMYRSAAATPPTINSKSQSVGSVSLFDREVSSLAGLSRWTRASDKAIVLGFLPVASARAVSVGFLVSFRRCLADLFEAIVLGFRGQ
jgi:hypothetical protein